MSRPELVAPAGSPEKLKYAIAYGADAVYLGGTEFGLRAAAATFSKEEITRAVEYAHGKNVKVYVTVNIFARNHDIENLPGYIRFLAEAGVDAVIVSDPGVLSLVREVAPGLKIHISTQANTTNWRSAMVWKSLGAERIVLARELSLDEIRDIGGRSGVELEVFVHGALCISYSGRCLLSSYMTGRDANRGDCAQACRWKYNLVEEKRPGEFFPVFEDQRGTYILSSKDLCLLEFIPALCKAGVSAFKIEGRVKSIHYVATTTGIYRAAIDEYIKDPQNYRVRPEWLEEIGKISNRQYTTGFIDAERTKNEKPFQIESIYNRNYTFTGVVTGYDYARGLLEVEQRNRFRCGDSMEILTPGMKIIRIDVDSILDGDGRLLEAAPHPRQVVYIPFPEPVPEYSLLRRAEHV